MIMNNRVYLLIVGLVIRALPSFSQEFDIKQLEMTSDGLVLHYDLNDTTKGQLYTIHMYSSKDNFVAPLGKVRGDIGIEVKPGHNKRVVWDAKELGADFNGNVEVEIRGKVYVPFVRFTNLHDYKSIKRGKPTTLLWTGGTRQNILNFNLYHNDELVAVIPNVANSGSYDIVIPTSVKRGSGYYFIVSDTKNKDLAMKTSSFAVKPKLPLALKIAPLLAVGIIGYTLIPEPAPDPVDDPIGTPGEKN
jgi:hypothetical protein